jgi:ribosomal protein S18 acetylase RimI-like enzyme
MCKIAMKSCTSCKPDTSREDEMTWQVLPIDRRHVTGFRDVLDAVARERRFLAFLAAPPLGQVRRFVRNNLQNGGVQFVAVDEGLVVGWCDVAPKTHETLRHSGRLGMGVAASHRGRGVGSALIAATLAAARTRGLTRIELDVRADNVAAIALYRRHGFEVEGRLRQFMVVDGVAYDALQMARLD